MSGPLEVQTNWTRLAQRDESQTLSCAGQLGEIGQLDKRTDNWIARLAIGMFGYCQHHDVEVSPEGNRRTKYLADRILEKERLPNRIECGFS